MIVVPRPPGVRLQEDIRGQQLHGIHTEQLLYRLPSHSRQKNQREISERQSSGLRT